MYKRTVFFLPERSLNNQEGGATVRVLYRVAYRTKDGCDGLGYVWAELGNALQDAAKLAQDPTIEWIGIKMSNEPDRIYIYPSDVAKLVGR